MTAKLTDIFASIDALASRGKLSRQRAFAAWFAVNFYDLDEDEALEAASADGGNDQGIDIAFYDDSNDEIVVLQAHCPENTNNVTPKNKWDAVVASIPYIKKPSKLREDGRPDLEELILSLKRDHISSNLTIGLITLGKRSPAIKSSFEAHSTAEEAFAENFLYLCQEDIISRYNALLAAEAGIPEEDIEFCGSCFEDSGAYGKAWVGSISSSELKRLHDVHEDKLFAGNIRLYLGSRKGGINEQIMKTAQNSPGEFWALNNGITIVADSATPNNQTNGNASLKVQRFSIVNGCQTTSSLVKAGAPADVKVLARIIAARAGLKTEIVRFNNTQNAIKIWTVRAADVTQEELRKEFLRHKIAYAPKQEGARKKKDPSRIELDKVAQYLASKNKEFLLTAVDNKSGLFDEPYQKIFPKTIKAIDVYLAWKVGNMADFERQAQYDRLKDDSNAGLLGVASTYWIVFCTYHLLDLYGNINSAALTLDAMKSDEFENALKKYVQKAVVMFYETAVDSYDRDLYGSFTSTLRSTKFLPKIESKIKIRGSSVGKLPDLAAVCKSSKKTTESEKAK